MNDILQITDNAVSRISNLLENNKDYTYFRIGTRTTGCAGNKFSFGLAKEIIETDLIVTKDNMTVIVTKEASEFLDGATLDFIEENFKSGFNISNIKACRSCGCGESFS